MGPKTSPTLRTRETQSTILAKSNNPRVRAVIRSLSHAYIREDTIFLGFAHEAHYDLAKLYIPSFETFLGHPVEVEHMPMLEEGLKLGGRVRDWE